MRNVLTSTLFATSAMVLLAGAASAQGRQSPPAPATKAVDAAANKAAQPPATGASLPYTGPKKRVAVDRFDANGAFVAQYGGSDLGGGLAAQLVTELAKTGRFIVVERASLAGVLREQQFGLTQVTTGETAPQAGQVLGAQLMIRGSVTEFDQSAGGKGLQLGIGFGPAALGLGKSSVTGRVAIDLRLIDTTTGEIVGSQRAAAEVVQRSVSADVAAGGVSLGKSGFEQTPLGAATREAIDRAVGFIVARMEAVPWSGRIVDVSDQAIYVNAGADAALNPGQRLVVSSVVKQLTDPASGAVLGVVERRVGEIEIASVQDKFSIARMVTPIQTARGDVVRFSANAPGVAVEKSSPVVAATQLPPPQPTVDALRQAIGDLESASAINPQPMLPMNTPMGLPMGSVGAMPSQGTMPGVGTGAMPGVGPGVMPSVGTGAMPGVGTGVMPGVGTGVTPGVGTGVMIAPSTVGVTVH